MVSFKCIFTSFLFPLAQVVIGCMSRIRLVNLPKECTEASLKSHLTSGLPHSAPTMEITDCSLKRGPDGKIRMGFVGFRTAAAGQFAIKHFNASYFRNCKMQVEAATGLNESVSTINLRKKVESGRGSLPVYIQGQSTAAEKQDDVGVKRGRKEDTHVSVADDASDNDDDATKKLKQRRKEFVEKRLNSSSANVPTWTNEVMLPQGAAVGYRDEESSSGAPLVPPPASATVPALLDDHAALEKQKTLGAMGDLDFLASLGGGLSNAHNEADSEDAAEGSAGAPAGSHTSSTHGNSSTAPPADIAPSASPQHPSHQRGTQDARDIVQSSRRVLVRGVPFVATEDDVKNYFSSKIGPVEAVHIPLTKDTKQSKGAAFVRFHSPDDAVACLSSLQGAVFMGRLIKVVGVEDDPYAKKAEETAARLAAAGTSVPQSAFKSKRAEERKATDASGASWNATFVSTNAAVESVAKRMGIASSDIVSIEHKGAAVRAAIAEAFLTSEVKAVLGDEGIDMDALNGAAHSALRARSNVTILVKNLSPKADLGHLSKMFVKFGTLDATAVPASGAFALFRFLHAQDARVAFQRLAYKPFGGQPLFLEWAPMGSIRDADDDGDTTAADAAGTAQTANMGGDTTSSDTAALAAKTQHLTLYVANLPFQLTEAQWTTYLQDACPRLTTNFAKMITRVTLQADKGRCFLTCADASSFKYLLSKLNGRTYEGRTLSCVASKSNRDASQQGVDSTAAKAEEQHESFKGEPAGSARGATLHGVGGSGGVPVGCNPLKLIVKNLPFEATERDLRELFSAFTEIKAVRVPKKINNFGAHRDNNHRGFGFVEFLTEQEAASALSALTSTHLYGRHLVLQYAKMGAE